MRIVGQLLLAMPDLEVVGVQFFLQAGVMVALQRTPHGTHRKKMRGIPPFNTKVRSGWTCL